MCGGPASGIGCNGAWRSGRPRLRRAGGPCLATGRRRTCCAAGSRVRGRLSVTPSFGMVPARARGPDSAPRAGEGQPPQRGAADMVEEAKARIQTRPLPTRSAHASGGEGEGGEGGGAAGAGRPPRPARPRDRYVPAGPSALASTLVRTVPSGLANVPGAPRLRRHANSSLHRRVGPASSSSSSSPRAATAGPKRHLRPLAVTAAPRRGPPPPPASSSSPIHYIPSRRHAPAAAVLAPKGLGVGAPLRGEPNAWAEAPRANAPPAPAPAPAPGRRPSHGGTGGGSRAPLLSSPPPPLERSRTGQQGGTRGLGQKRKARSGIWGYATRNDGAGRSGDGARRASAKHLTSKDPVPSTHVLEVPLGVKYGLGT